MVIKISKDSLIKVRVSNEHKKILISYAKSKNITLSELVLSSIKIDDDFFYEEKEDVFIDKKYQVTSYLDVEEYNLVIAEVNKSRLSVSRYVAEVLLGHQVIVYEDLKEFVGQLSKIGTNINQLSKLANMGKISVVDLDEVKNLLNDVWKKINRMV